MQRLFPILDRPLWIGQIVDRARIRFILNRAQKWLAGLYFETVSNQIAGVWKGYNSV